MIVSSARLISVVVANNLNGELRAGFFEKKAAVRLLAAPTAVYARVAHEAILVEARTQVERDVAVRMVAAAQVHLEPASRRPATRPTRLSRRSSTRFETRAPVRYEFGA